MKLFFSPGACSFSPHAILNELGIPFQLVRVDMKTKKTADGEDFLKINPSGYVPALQLDSGEVLTEGVAMTQYLADLKPESKLAPKLGSMERYHLMEMLNFITSEIHKGFSPLFGADTIVPNKEGNAQLREFTLKKLATRVGHLADVLANKPYLMGEQVTIADFYAMTCLRWSKSVGFDLTPWPAITSFMARMQERPSVLTAIKAEGLKG
ncbi:glutathione transferase GstA [soil metagenome]